MLRYATLRYVTLCYVMLHCIALDYYNMPWEEALSKDMADT